MATTNWKTPGTSGEWSATTNWDNGVPNATTTIANIGGTTAYTVTIDNGSTFQVGTVNLSDAKATLQENGDLVVATAANIGGTLSLTGKLDLSAGATADVTGTMTLNNSADIVGGTLAGAGIIATAGAGGTIALDGTGASGLTIAKATTVAITDNTRLDLGGSGASSAIVNHGEISLNAAADDATLSVDVPVTLSGGGTVRLSDSAFGTNEILGNGSLTNVDNTIEGVGTIYNGNLNITNDAGGTIEADTSPASDIGHLTIQNGTVSNAGIVAASGLDELILKNLTISNTGGTGTLEATGSNAEVFLQNSTVQGGTLTTSASSFIGAFGTSAFDLTTSGVTITSGSTVYDQSILQLIGLGGAARTGVLNNAGTLNLSDGGSGSELIVANNVQLTGGGTIELLDGGANTIISSASAQGTLENVNNTIQGQGTISGSGGLSIINDVGGTIDGNSNQATLSIEGVTITNKGVVEATSQGSLSFGTSTLNDTGGGTLEALGAGSGISLYSSTVEGGTLTTTGGAEIDTFVGGTGAVFDSSAGAITISSGSNIAVVDNSTLYLRGMAGAGQSGTVSNAGTIAVDGISDATNLTVQSNVKLTNGGIISLTDSSHNVISGYSSGSSLDNVGNTIQGAGTVSGANNFVLTNDTGGTIDADFGDTPLNVQATLTNTALATLEATNGGTLALSGADTLGGAIVGTAGSTVALSGASTFNNLTLGGGVTLDVAAALGNATGGVTFASSSTATLELDAAVLPATGGIFANPIGAFSQGETIDLRALAFTGTSTPVYNSVTGLLVVTENGISDTLDLAMPNATAFTTTSDGHGGTDVTAAVCFASGTRIRTARGEIAVEDLVVGDRAVTATRGTRPVVWIGHRDIDCRGRHDLCPVRVAAHAFGDDLPARDLLLSPGHPILVGGDADNEGGHLVPIMCLVNGTTIERVEVDAVTYWHVELDLHDILLAEGLPAESYIDWGDRGFFSEGSDHVLLNPDFVVPGLAGRCRPVAVDGAIVEAERARLDIVFATRLAAACAWPIGDAPTFGWEINGFDA